MTPSVECPSLGLKLDDSPKERVREVPEEVLDRSRRLFAPRDLVEDAPRSVIE